MEILDASAPGFADRFDRVVNARRESANDVSRDVADIIAKLEEAGGKPATTAKPAEGRRERKSFST